MSYFPIDTMNQEMINKQSVDISMTDRQKNMKYARHMQPHTDESKRKISEGQRSRYDYYRKAVSNMITEDRVREIITETINDYFKKNTNEVKNNKPNNIPL
jgi:H2-forming N5,N10-methylenetetrahydromethanopterin dehydrogenase-like enzyme